MNGEDYLVIAVGDNNEVLVRADIVAPHSYSISDPKYYPADGAVGLLYAQVPKGSNPRALDILVELAGNYWNKLAFNALNQLGNFP